MASQDKYKEVRTFYFDNAIVRVHIPDLTNEERERRMKLIHDAAAALLMSSQQTTTTEIRRNT